MFLWDECFWRNRYHLEQRKKRNSLGVCKVIFSVLFGNMKFLNISLYCLAVYA